MMPRAHQLREGETVIGRAPTCDLVITAALMSRQHARVRVVGDRVFLRDAGSTYGTTFKGEKLKEEVELHPGDTFSVGPLTLTLEREVHENEVLSEKHQIFEESDTIFKRMDRLEQPPVSPPQASGQTSSQAEPVPAAAPIAAGSPAPATWKKHRAAAVPV